MTDPFSIAYRVRAHVAAILVLLLPSIMLADEFDELDQLLGAGLETLMSVQVVTPGRQSQSVAQAPANITAITAETIERRGYQTLEEVLLDVSGFEITTSQPAGEYPTHFIFRGITDLGQTKTLIMVDGTVQNDVSNGWARGLGYDLILSDVERIEVVSGPGSALYGANAYAGLINIITKPIHTVANGWHVDTRTLYGAHGTLAPELSATYRSADDWAVRVAGRWFRTDGDNGDGRPDPGGYFTGNFEPDSVLTTEFGNIANERVATGTTRPLADGFGTGINDVYLRGKAQKGGVSLDANFWDKREDLGSEVVGYEYFTNTNGIDYRVHHRGYTVASTYDADLRPDLASRTKLYFRSSQILPETGFVYTYKYQRVDNGIDPGTLDKIKGYHGEGYVAGLEQQFNLSPAERHAVVFGLQLEQEIKQYFGISLGHTQSSASNIIASTYASETETVQPLFFSKNAAFYLQDQYQIDDELAFTGGLRLDLDDEYGHVLNPRLTLVRSPQAGPGFKLLYGQAFKAPTVFELFDEFRGNEVLEPEKVATSELEVNYRLPKAHVRAGVFYSRLTDIIVVAPNPDTTRVPIGPSSEHLDYFQNVGSTSIRGANLGFEAQLRALHGYGHYTLTAGKDGDDLDNTARHKASFGVDSHLNVSSNMDLNVDLRANWRGRVKAPVSNSYFQPKTAQSIAATGYDYVTEANPDGYMAGDFLVHLTITARHRLSHGGVLQPQLVVRNLFDASYSGIGRQSGSGARPVEAIQPAVQNPSGFIPAYHPQPGRQVLVRLRYLFSE
jgi:outer membrane receptor for ferrienterochelin and colicins